MMIWPAPHIRKGLLRLYFVLVIPWVLVLGYIAYDNHNWYVSYRETSREWLVKVESAPDRQDYRSIHEADVFWRDKLLDRRNAALVALPVLPIGLPVLWLAFVWISSGFRSDQKPTTKSGRDVV
jgi:hypothetical protein